MEDRLRLLRLLVAVLIWPGDKVCAYIGLDPMSDSGMFRGFVNNVVWGGVAILAMYALM